MYWPVNLGCFISSIYISLFTKTTYPIGSLQEFRLAQPDDPLDTPLTPDPNLVFTKQDLPKTEEEWIKLVRKQEILHQLELEKWHQVSML